LESYRLVQKARNFGPAMFELWQMGRKEQILRQIQCRISRAKLKHVSRLRDLKDSLKNATAKYIYLNVI
jgi:hypothetical protein